MADDGGDAGAAGTDGRLAKLKFLELLGFRPPAPSTGGGGNAPAPAPAPANTGASHAPKKTGSGKPDHAPRECDEATDGVTYSIYDDLDINDAGVSYVRFGATVKFRNNGSQPRVIHFQRGSDTDTFSLDPGEEDETIAVRHHRQRNKGVVSEKDSTDHSTKGTITLDGWDDGTTRVPTTSVAIWICL